MYLNIGQGNALVLENIGGCANNDYWGSTDPGLYNAWRQYFGNGFQNYYNKNGFSIVRAVRAF